jgi:hypothetical protein
MKINSRILLGVSALAFLLVAAPALSAEVDVTGENHRTGADSYNKNKFDIEHDFYSKVRNHSDVKNKAYADVSTGYNKQNKNTQAGDLDTGSVDASTDWETVVNEGTSMMGAEADLEVSADFSNDTTGFKSKNVNKLGVHANVYEDLRNFADISNKLALWANTGYNTQSKNTEAGELTTGDVEVEAAISNHANNGTGMASAAGHSVSVDVDAENATTGAKSTNKNTVEVASNHYAKVRNEADIDNKVKVSANTGYNTQSKNTKGGDMETGSVEVSTDIHNAANNGSGLSGASSSALDVSADLSNDTTGADSTNKNTVAVAQNMHVDVKNTADVENKLSVEANTGGNEQNKNTEGGSTTTGDVRIEFNSSTTVNSSH